MKKNKEFCLSVCTVSIIIHNHNSKLSLDGGDVRRNLLLFVAGNSDNSLGPIVNVIDDDSFIPLSPLSPPPPPKSCATDFIAIPCLAVVIPAV
ncbi:hypothetical protein DERP_000702 [Dermatophagoides pteronyssinus]|uniref:Uncharacterized protein n=1 Tax=Dermatophagoides pteronyssinus TaxID=6956 RepID=A0ABQ8J0X2_DERPT|nr:hypothetical protein DERP_000702 [Dermatophagoides pteronyssinus]